MYLKRVDILGFKSFAEKTRLEFEPGMTAIVGPNGCGKSNVSDAVRWVLGESRPTAIRGSSMEDCIFNGTDSQKPLGMAEVTLTLAECEKTLDLGLDEVSITRRVFRSGESDYFINKKACRRKDIQRLFMDTGVGTDSYSIMEQGKIDQILSSRPDDRRAVFEEASGITRYKTDKKEAMRKLEQTEANLLRLADVIREVKRQIISLQRQAGKARRFKDLQQELRSLDIYATRHRLKVLDGQVNQTRKQLESLRVEIDTVHHENADLARETDALRESVQGLEQAIATAMDESMRIGNELERARQMIQTNSERVAELETLSRQNTRESEEASERLVHHRASLAEIDEQMNSADAARRAAAQDVEKTAARLREIEEQVHAGRGELSALRDESMALDGRIGRLQNDLSEIDGRERASVIRREQLAAEKTGLQRTLTAYEQRSTAMATAEEELQQAVRAQQETLDALRSRQSGSAETLRALESECGDLQNSLADKKARLEMLVDAREEDFPAGARYLLDENADFLIGPLAEQLSAKPGYELALQAALRPWMDALVVRTRKESRTVLTLLAEQDRGAVRLLSADGDAPDRVEGSLLDSVVCTDEIRPLAARLLASIRVFPSLQEIPLTLTAGATAVTQRGELWAADGAAECWRPAEGEANPLARTRLREQLQQEISRIERDLATRRERIEAVTAEQAGAADAMESARNELDERRRALAIQEGERQVISRELKQARDRVDTVSCELEQLIKEQSGGEDQRGALAREISEARERLTQIRQQSVARADAVQALDEQRASALADASESRLILSQHEQRIESLTSRRQPLEARIRELEELVSERSRGISSYQQRIEQLHAASRSAEEQMPELLAGADAAAKKLDQARADREARTAALSAKEQALRQQQARLEELQNQKTGFEVGLAEQRMRRQNALDRLTSAWRITEDQLAREPAPQWGDEGEPAMEEIETRVAELRAKLESIGPVNLVAIEEHAELEERFAFLSKQESDLTSARDQLLEMIKKINATTTELFTETFRKVNANFEETFKQLFGGGSAKLVLVDETDVLESGIEIIARPPGKKLQTISLLSGGERTMTAVALLFSLFKVKPSPFCVLDEIDAALDEANINRFIGMLKGFLTQSQFILITHSRQTIASADIIYGVTMPARGVSRVMSMKFSDYQESDATPA